MSGKNSGLEALFVPKSIAVIGASESSIAYGTRYLQSLLDYGYKGKLFAVNHNGENALGFKIYRSVADIPDDIDLASVFVPARFVPGVLQDCLKKKVKAAIVMSSGFSESGEEGRKLEEEIVGIARSGIRVLGPNCFGTYCPRSGITIVTGATFTKETGGTALIAQSGQASEGIVYRSSGEGVRYSKVASYGNACNVNESDLLEYLMQDSDTKVVTSYLEGVKDGRRFFEIARTNAGKKPIIIWKVGLTQAGAAAAASHTGSLAGGPAVWDTFFRQTRSNKVGTLEELVDTTVAFSCIPGGCGRNAVLISGGGSGGVIGADAAEAKGISLKPLATDVEEKLKKLLPATGTSIKNPLDIGNPHPSVQLLQSVLEAIAASDQTDVIVIRRLFFSAKVSAIFSGTTALLPEEQQAFMNVPVEVSKKYKKPIVIILPEEFTGVNSIELEADRRRIRDFFFRNGIPVYPNELRAFTSISHLAKFKEAGAVKVIGQDKLIEVDESAGNTASKIIKTASTPVLDEISCKRIFKEYGINVTEPVLSKTRSEAVSSADKIGYPVVMKIVSPQIIHKSDIGGVKINLKNADDVTKAFDEIVNAAKEKVPDAVIEGISVQKMARSGLELVMGMTKDPQFGPVLMFGLGGVLVEVLKDVSFRIVPLTQEDAYEMIREIKAYRLLEGYRGQPPVDVKYLSELLLKISKMIEQNPAIKEMDINPLIAYPDGAVAVDARIILEGSK